jgi:hypothetical protein
MKTFKFFALLGLVGLLFTTGCDKDEDPLNLMITTITADGTSFSTGSAVTKDLNGASSATDVPLNANITITFDKAPDVTSISSSTIALTSDAGGIGGTVTSSGNSIVVDPETDFQRGTIYTISISGLKAADGGLFTNTSRTFTTEGRAPVVVPNASSMIAYWTFDGHYDDETGTYNGNYADAITYGDDRHGQGNSTATFDGDKSIIEVPNAQGLMASNDFTLSFWVKTNSNGHVNANGDPAGYFVMGMAAFFGFQFEIPADFGSCKLACSYEMGDGTFESEDTWFPGDGKDKDNGGWQGWDFVADLTGSGGVPSLLQDKWAHIICVYNAAEKQGRMYINGDLMKSWDFDLWPDGAAKKTAVGVGYRGVSPETEPELAFGFIQSRAGTLWDTEPWGGYDFPTANHFKGDLDDIRIFSAAYSEADAKALYDAEKN